jgi:hypothetical protein
MWLLSGIPTEKDRQEICEILLVGRAVLCNLKSVTVENVISPPTL